MATEISSMTLAEVNGALEAEYAEARRVGRSNLPPERLARYDSTVRALNDRKSQLVRRIASGPAIGNGLFAK